MNPGDKYVRKLGGMVVEVAAVHEDNYVTVKDAQIPRGDLGRYRTIRMKAFLDGYKPQPTWFEAGKVYRKTNTSGLIASSTVYNILAAGEDGDIKWVTYRVYDPLAGMTEYFTRTSRSILFSNYKEVG